MLKFSSANAKLRGLASVQRFLEKRNKRGELYIFDLPAGKSCPGALECKSQAVKTPEGWRIKDGKACRFRCYAASQEAVLPPTRNIRTHNLRECKTILRSTERIARGIIDALPPDASIVRLHSSGDFYSLPYLKAWLLAAKTLPDVLFYGYTKCLHFWSAIRFDIADLPNFELVASYGGKYDHLIDEYSFRSCRVVNDERSANLLGLPIDHDDTHAAGFHGLVNFALLIHGTQPKGSEEAKAVYRLRKAGLTGYKRDGKGYGFKKITK